MGFHRRFLTLSKDVNLRLVLKLERSPTGFLENSKV